MSKIDDSAMRQLFQDARTFSYWQEDKRISDELLHELHELLALPPTSANCSPGRFVFIRSLEAKARLKPALMEGNADKTMKAPVTAIIAYDMRFLDHLPQLYPPTDAKSWFEGNEPLIKETAFRNGTLQGAYLIMAARSLGLDCGPMSGFDQDLVDKEFFSGTTFRSNFLCNLGYGNRDKVYPRSPRFNFDEVCQIL